MLLASRHLCLSVGFLINHYHFIFHVLYLQNIKRTILWILLSKFLQSNRCPVDKEPVSKAGTLRFFCAFGGYSGFIGGFSTTCVLTLRHCNKRLLAFLHFNFILFLWLICNSLVVPHTNKEVEQLEHFGQLKYKNCLNDFEKNVLIYLNIHLIYNPEAPHVFSTKKNRSSHAERITFLVHVKFIFSYFHISEHYC